MSEWVGPSLGGWMGGWCNWWDDQESAQLEK